MSLELFFLLEDFWNNCHWLFFKYFWKSIEINAIGSSLHIRWNSPVKSWSFIVWRVLITDSIYLLLLDLFRCSLFLLSSFGSLNVPGNLYISSSLTNLLVSICLHIFFIYLTSLLMSPFSFLIFWVFVLFYKLVCVVECQFHLFLQKPHSFFLDIFYVFNRWSLLSFFFFID